MNKKEFNTRLKSVGLSKKKMSEILGVRQTSVNNWGQGGKEVPYWIESWLDMYEKANKYDALMELICTKRH